MAERNTLTSSAVALTRSTGCVAASGPSMRRGESSGVLTSLASRPVAWWTTSARWVSPRRSGVYLSATGWDQGDRVRNSWLMLERTVWRSSSSSSAGAGPGSFWASAPPAADSGKRPSDEAAVLLIEQAWRFGAATRKPNGRPPAAGHHQGRYRRLEAQSRSGRVAKAAPSSRKSRAASPRWSRPAAKVGRSARSHGGGWCPSGTLPAALASCTVVVEQVGQRRTAGRDVAGVAGPPRRASAPRCAPPLGSSPGRATSPIHRSPITRWCPR